MIERLWELSRAEQTELLRAGGVIRDFEGSARRSDDFSFETDCECVFAVALEASLLHQCTGGSDAVAAAFHVGTPH
jgi:hypothetical protein